MGAEQLSLSELEQLLSLGPEQLWSLERLSLERWWCLGDRRGGSLNCDAGGWLVVRHLQLRVLWHRFV